MGQTLNDFRDRVDGAPIDLFDAAYEATEVTDDEILREFGKDLINAKEAFEAALEEREIELG